MLPDIVDKIRAFNRLYTAIIGVTNGHYLESDLSLTEVRILYEIYHAPDITARQIMAFVQIDEGYFSRSIAKLKKMQLLTRNRLTKDRRAFGLSLTKKGESLFLKLNHRSSELIASTIDHLSREEQVEMIRLLERLQLLWTKKTTKDDAA